MIGNQQCLYHLVPTWSNSVKNHTHTPQPFYSPFSETTQVSRCQKRNSGL